MWVCKHARRWLAVLGSLAFAALITTGGGLRLDAASGRELAPLVPGHSIITSIAHHFVDDNNQLVADDQVTQGDNLSLSMEWALPDGVVQAGDYYRFSLPAQATGFSESGPLDGPAGVLGEYSIADNVVTMTFNQNAASLNQVTGTLTLASTALHFDHVGEQTIELPLTQTQQTRVPITVVPEHRVDIAKTGAQVGDSDTIAWTLAVNNTHQRMQNAWLDEQLPANMNLAAVAIHTATVAPDGSLTPDDTALQEGVDFDVDRQAIRLRGAYADTDAALVVTVTTKLKDADEIVAHQQVANSVTLHWEGQNQPQTPTATADINMHYFPKKWLEKLFNGPGNGEDVYLWRVQYNEAATTLAAGTTLVDTLPAGQTFEQSGNNFWLNYGDCEEGRVYPGEPLTADDYTLAYAGNQMTVTLKHDVSRPLVLVYGVHVPGAVDQQPLTNTVEDNHGHHTEGSGVIEKKVELVKSVVASNDAQHTIDWRVDLNRTRQPLADYQLTDQMSGSDAAHPEISLQPDSLAVVDQSTGKTLVAGVDYQLTYTAGAAHFALRLIGDYASTKDYFQLSYTTEYAADAAANTVWSNRIDGPDVEAHGDYTPGPQPVDTKVGNWHAAGHYFQWDITANNAHAALQGATVTDKIDAAQRFLSVAVYNLDDNRRVDAASDLPSAANNQTLTVHLPDGTAAYRVEVKTTPVDSTQAMNYTDIASFNHGDVTQPLGPATIWPDTNGKLVVKTGEQDADDKTKVDWYVDVNLAQAHLVNAVVTDIASANQRIDPKAITVVPLRLTDYNSSEATPDAQSPLTLGEDYTVSSRLDGTSGKTVTEIHWLKPMDTPYRIQYQATIHSAKITDTVTNGVRLEADHVVQDKTNAPTEVSVLVVGATADGVSGRYTLTKRGAENQAPLAGAKFSLTPVDDPDNAREVTTDDKGQATWDSLLSGDYYLKEVQAPEGYQLNSAYTGRGKKVSVAFTDEQPTVATTVTDSKRVLPHTGGWGRLALLLLGCVAAAGSLVALRRRLRA